MAVEAEEESAVAAARRQGREARACVLETHHGRLRLIRGLGEGGGAPRSEDGELVARRREIHSGRALLVSTVVLAGGLHAGEENAGGSPEGARPACSAFDET